MKLLLATHLLCSIGMFGVIWIVQLVHYPLFDRVDRDDYVSFQRAHEARISFVVLPLMLGELVTGIFLVTAATAESRTIWLIGIGLVGVAWLSTFLLSVPSHQTLGTGFDPEAHSKLVSTNWIRTFAWSAHAILALYGAFVMLDAEASPRFGPDDSSPTVAETKIDRSLSSVTK